MSDYSKLTRLAEAATPGEWQAYDTHGKRFIESMIGEAHVVCDTPKKQWLKDSEYIAAANPSVVLSMIAENKRLAELLECAQGDCRQAMQIIERLTPDAERLNWLDERSIPVVEGQCWSFPEGELWGYSWTVAGQRSTVREAIDDAMSKPVQP